MGKIAVFSMMDAFGDVSTESAGYFDWANSRDVNITPTKENRIFFRNTIY